MLLYHSDEIAITQNYNCRHLWFTNAPPSSQLQGSLDLDKPFVPVIGYVERMVSHSLNFETIKADGYAHAWVLGLGCGSIAHTLHHRYPGLGITLVEVSSEVLMLAQRFFLCPSKHPQWSYVQADITQWLSEKKIDLNIAPHYVALDAYKGNILGPSIGLGREYFLLAQLLHPAGCLVVNLQEQYALKEHLKKLDDAFEGRVKIFFRAGEGNPVAFAYGTQSWFEMQIKQPVC